jgi:predicted DNA-binding transcriptional regulator YafY
MLESDEEISGSSLSKDIAYINERISTKGVSIKCTHARGYHYTVEGFSMFRKEVDEEDKNLLMLASSVFSLFQGTMLQQKFSDLVDKVLSESLVGKGRQGLSELQLVQLGAGPVVNGSQWIPALLDAILSKETLVMVYEGIRKPAKQKHICPYVIKKHLNRWYMVAYDHNCERKMKTNVFSLDGIRSLDVSNRPYVSDPDFIPEDFFSYSLGVWQFHEKEPVHVELEFSGYIEEILVAPIHHSQRSKLSPDRKLLQVEITVYDSPELEMLIRGFGPHVKVISPRSLADRILLQASDTTKLYS